MTRVDIPVPITTDGAQQIIGTPSPNLDSVETAFTRLFPFVVLEEGMLTPKDVLHCSPEDVSEMAKLLLNQVEPNQPPVPELVVKARIRQFQSTCPGQPTQLSPFRSSVSGARSGSPGISPMTDLRSSAVGPEARKGGPKIREVQRLIPVYGKRFSGASDGRPISVWLSQVQAVQVSEGLLCQETWSVAVGSLDHDLRRDVELHVAGRGVLDYAARLDEMASFLLHRFRRTDDVSRAERRLLAVTQQGRPLEEFLREFRARLGEMQCVGGPQVLSPQQQVERFRERLDFQYKECARQFMVCQGGEVDLVNLADVLLAYEEAYRADTGHLPNASRQLGRASKPSPRVNAVEASALPSTSRPNKKPTRGICFEFRDHGTCKFGDNCRFSHHVEPKPLGPDSKRNVDETFGNARVVESNSVSVQSSPGQVKVAQVSCAPDDASVIELDICKQWSLPIYDQSGRRLSPLIDSGATVNLVSKELADEWVSSGVGKEGWLKNPLSGRSYSGTSEMCSRVVKVPLRLHNAECEPVTCTLLVSQCCSPNIILGGTFMSKELGISLPGSPVSANSPRVTSISPSMTPDIPTAAGRALQFQPLLECVDGKMQVSLPPYASSVLPYTEKPRRRSPQVAQIIHAWALQAESDGKIEKTDHKEAGCVLELVFIDKKSDQPRVDIKSEVASGRYRATIDARVVNQMKLTPHGWLPASELKETRGAEIEQSQIAPIDILHSWPRQVSGKQGENADQFWFTVDIKDGFNNIKLHQSLRRIFCFRTISPEGTECIWRFCTLPQGFKWSPVLFSRAISYVLSTLGPSTEGFVRHYQDDVLGSGSTLEEAQNRYECVIVALRQHGFQVRPDKCTPPTPAVVWCGYSIKGLTFQPVNDIIMGEELSRLNELLDDQLESRFRSWAGCFNWMRGWLSPDLLKGLALLSSKTALKSERIKGFANLAEAYFAGLPAMAIGGCGRPATVVVCDANRDRYAALILAVVARASTDPLLSDGQDLPRTVFSELGLDPNDFGLVPILITGGAFSTQESQQSSTWRERYAQLLVCHRYRHIIHGRLLIVNDNRNASTTWHDVEETYSGPTLRKFVALTQMNPTFLWISRSCSIGRLVDSLARDDSDPQALVKAVTIDTGPNDLGGQETRPKRTRAGLTPSQAYRAQRMAAGEASDRESAAGSEQQGTPTEMPDTPDLDGPADSREEPDVSDWQLGCGLDMPNQQEWRKFYSASELEIYGPLVDGLLIDADGKVRVPKVLSRALVQMIHHYYHGGSKATETLIKRYGVSVPGLRRLCEVSSDCIICAQHKSAQGTPLGKLPLPDSPMMVVGLDFCSMNSETTLLVGRCHFSGWTDASFVENVSAEVVVDFLEYWSARYGRPWSIWTDNGAAFTSTTLRGYLQSRNIRFSNTPIYSPRSNGQTERVIRTLTEGIACITADGVSLYRALQRCLHRLNRSGRVPALGKSEYCPRDLIFKCEEPSPLIAVPHPTPPRQRHALLGKFSVGERVLVRNRGHRTKLDPVFIDRGFSVAHKVANYVYALYDDEGDLLPCSYAERDLKLI